MSERTVAERAARLIRAATGEESGGGYVVSDLIIGYAEPGYGSDDAVIVMGNWNPKRFPRDGEPALTKEENIGPRLAEALEKVGAETQWLDEWLQCSNCYRAFRSCEDSYSWRMHGAIVNDCEPVCADCMREDVNAYLEEGNHVDNARSAVTWCDARDLENAGWEQWEPRDPHTYESGWHPGQDDNPETITAEIRREMGDAVHVVFLLSESSQFYIRFQAFTRFDRVDESDAGCWVDGHWGQYALAHWVQRANDHGYNDPEMVDYATRHLASMSPNGDEPLTDDEWQAMHDGADDVEAWMTEHIAPVGYSFGWWEGEVMLWSDDEWEEAS